MVDGIAVITEIPSQRYTVLHVDTTESDCLVHDATSQAPDEAVFTSTSSYQEYCGRFNHSTIKALILLIVYLISVSGDS